MQVRDEHIEALCRDKSQSFCHIGGSDYLKSFVFKRHSHHVANGVVVIHEQYFVRNRGSVGVIQHRLSSRTNASMA